MAIDEKSLTKGQVRKLNALRKSIGDELADDAFSKWLVRPVTEAPKTDPVADRITEALAGLDDDRKFNLGLYGYTVRRAKGKGKSGVVAVKNDKSR